MNVLDLSVAVILLLTFSSGWRRGLLAELGSLAVLLLFPWALGNFSGSLLGFWSLFLAAPPLAWLLSLLSIIGCLLLVGKLIGAMLAQLLPRFLLPLNSLAGASLALLKTLLWLGIVACLLSRLPQLAQTPLWQESLLLKPLAALGELLLFSLSRLLPQPPSYYQSPWELI